MHVTYRESECQPQILCEFTDPYPESISQAAIVPYFGSWAVLLCSKILTERMLRPGGATANRKAMQAASTREALMDVGRARFGDEGFGATVIEDLATEAGVTKGALYHHFKGKEDLFRAVYERAKQQITELVAPSFLEQDAWTALLAGCDAIIDAHLDPVVRRIVLIDGPAVLAPEVVREVENRYGAVVLRGALRKAMNAQVLERQPLVALARMLNGALIEACALVIEADRPSEMREEVGHIVHRLLVGLQEAQPGSTNC